MKMLMRTRLLLASGLILVLVLAGLLFTHKNPPGPDKVLAAVIVEIDPGNSARPAVDTSNAVRFINDDDETSPVPISFDGHGSPCSETATQLLSSGQCDITTATPEVYSYLYCPDLKSSPGDTAHCPAPWKRELRVRDSSKQGELPEISANVVYLGLTKYGQVNHFVIAGSVVEWAKRDHPDKRRKVVFTGNGNPSNPCGTADGVAIHSCTIQTELDDEFNYDCDGSTCTDPTLHVRSQNPNPTTPLSTPTPAPGSN